MNWEVVTKEQYCICWFWWIWNRRIFGIDLFGWGKIVLNYAWIRYNHPLLGGWLPWLPWLYRFWLIKLSMFMRLLVKTPSKFTELSRTGCRLLLLGLLFMLICCCCWVYSCGMFCCMLMFVGSLLSSWVISYINLICYPSIQEQQSWQFLNHCDPVSGLTV